MRIAALGEDACEIEPIRLIMERAGHDCVAFDSSRSLLCHLRQQKFDLVIVLCSGAQFQGLRVVRWMREERGNWLPILLVTDRNAEPEWVAALSAGADQLMAKPVRAAELQARVDALLRRSCVAHCAPELKLGGFHFLLATQELWVDGKPVELSPREYALALFMFQRLGLLVSRDQLADAVWGDRVEPASRSIDMHMSRLRAKLDLRPSKGFLLSAAYRQGYRLEVTDPHPFDSPRAPASSSIKLPTTALE